MNVALCFDENQDATRHSGSSRYINLLARSVTPLMASTPFMIKFSKLAAIELGSLGSADRQRPSRFEAHTNV